MARLVPDLEHHPLPALLRAGVPCSLNADDTLVFDTTLAAEYRLARDRLGLDDAERAAIARTSVEAGAVPRARARAALAGIDDWLAGVPTPTGGPGAR